MPWVVIPTLLGLVLQTGFGQPAEASLCRPFGLDAIEAPAALTATLMPEEARLTLFDEL